MGRSLIGVDLFFNELVLVPPQRYQDILVEPKKNTQPKEAEIEEEKVNSATPKKKKQSMKSEMEEKKENSAKPKQVKSTEKSQISVIPMKPAEPEVPRRKIVLDIEENKRRTKNVTRVSAGE